MAEKSDRNKVLQRRRPWKKWVLYALIALVIVSFFLLLLFKEKILENVIKDAIYAESKGRYSIRFEELDYRFRDNSILLLDFSLRGDTSRHNESNASIYEVLIDTVELNRVSFLSLYRNRVLDLSAVRISRPLIKIFKTDTSHLTKPHEELEDALKKGIQKFFVKAQIELFSITSGQIEVFHFSADTMAAYSVKSFDVNLHDFLLSDSIKSYEKKLFFSDDLDIVLHNFSSNFKNHKLDIEYVRLSTASQSVDLEGLELQPLDDTAYTWISLYAPWSRLNGFNLPELLYQGNFVLDTLLILKPDLKVSHISANTNLSSTRFSNEDLLLALPQGTLHFGLQKVLIKDADIEIKNYRPGKNETLRLESMNASLSGMQIDSTIINQARDSLVKGDLLLSSQKTRYYDEAGTSVESGVFHYSLSNKRFSVRDFYFIDPGKFQDSLILVIPSLKLTGVSLWRILSGDLNTLKALELQDVKIVKVINKAQNDHSERMTMPRISLASINSGNTEIQLVVRDSVGKKGQFIGRLDFVLHQLKLDTSSPLGLQQPQYVKLETKDLFWEDTENKNQVHASLLFDSRKKSLLFEDFNLYSGKQKEDPNKFEITGFSFPAFEISNFDYWELLEKQYLNIDRARLKQPRIELLTHTGTPSGSTTELHKDLYVQLTKYLQLIRMDHFAIEDLSISVVRNDENTQELKLDGIDASLSQLMLDAIFDQEKEDMFFAKDFDIQINNLRFPYGFEDTLLIQSIALNEKKHQVKLHEIRSLAAQNAGKINPGLLTPGIHIPDLYLNGVDFNAYYFDKKMKIDTVLVPLSSLVLESVKLHENETKESVVSYSAPNMAISYEIDKFLLEGLDFEVRNANSIPVSFYLKSQIHGIAFDSSLVFEPFKSSLPLQDFIIDLKHPSFSPDTNSRIEFDSIKLNFAKQEMRAHGLSYHGLFGQAKSELSVLLNGFNISGLDYQGFFSGKGLGLKSLDLDSCTINYKKNESGNTSVTAQFHPLAKPLHSIKADDVRFRNIDLALQSEHDNGTIQLNNISGLAKNFLFDSVSFHNQQRPFFADDIKLSKPEYTIISKDSMYTFSFDSVSLSSAEERIRIGSFRIKPNYLKYEFSRKLGYQTDRMDVNFEGISVNAFDFKNIMESKTLRAGQVQIDNTYFEAFRDKRVPFPEWHTSPMPQDLIASLDFGLDVDTLILKKAKIVYGEMVEKSVEPGEIHFNDMNILLSNITNISQQISNDPVMAMRVRGRIMDKGELNALLKLKLNHPSDTFAFHASLSKMDLSEFNSLSVNLFGVEIKSGDGAVDTLNIFGNHDYAIGQLYFPYRKFKIKMINRQKGNRGGIGDGVLSFLANNILLKSNNRRFGRPVRVGQIFYQRDPQKSIFNYLWKGVLSGVESTLGYNTREQKKEVKEYKEKLRQVE